MKVLKKWLYSYTDCIIVQLYHVLKMCMVVKNLTFFCKIGQPLIAKIAILLTVLKHSIY